MNESAGHGLEPPAELGGGAGGPRDHGAEPAGVDHTQVGSGYARSQHACCWGGVWVEGGTSVCLSVCLSTIAPNPPSRTLSLCSRHATPSLTPQTHPTHTLQRARAQEAVPDHRRPHLRAHGQAPPGQVPRAVRLSVRHRPSVSDSQRQSIDTVGLDWIGLD